MNEKITIIQEILKRHNYLVEVHHTENGCKAIFPRRREVPQFEPFEFVYNLNFNKRYVQVTNTRGGQAEGGIILLGPPYSHKVLIMFHLIKVCNKIKYDYSLIQFFINKEQVEESKFLQAITYSDMSLEDLQKEHALILLSVPAFQDNFKSGFMDMAAQQNIQEGYEAAMRIFSDRGDND